MAHDIIAPAAGGASSLIGRALQHFSAVFRRRRACLNLERLDDRLLRDIGLSRADLDGLRRHW